jgi:hypothetical protein
VYTSSSVSIIVLVFIYATWLPNFIFQSDVTDITLKKFCDIIWSCSSLNYKSIDKCYGTCTNTCTYYQNDHRVITIIHLHKSKPSPITSNSSIWRCFIHSQITRNTATNRHDITAFQASCSCNGTTRYSSSMSYQQLLMNSFPMPIWSDCDAYPHTINLCEKRFIFEMTTLPKQ